MSMEEVNKLLKSMVNDLTKVKQGLVAHSFVGKKIKLLGTSLSS